MEIHPPSLWASLASLLISAALSAQDSLGLSLDQAIERGLAGNLPLRAESLNLERDAARLRQSSSVLYPSVTASGGIQHYFNTPVQYAEADILNPSAPSHAFVGLKLLLPNSYAAGVNVNWTIYNQALFAALKIVQSQSILTGIQLQRDQNDLAFTIGRLYYGIVFAEKQRDHLTKVTGNLERLSTLLQANYENGLVLKTELDKVGVSQTTIRSQIDELSAAIGTQENLLKLTLGLPKSARLRLTTADPDQSLPLPGEDPARPSASLDLQLAQMELQLTHLERKAILAARWPTLGLNYNFSYNVVSPNLHSLFDSKFDFPVQFIGLNLSVPLFNGNSLRYKLQENTTKTRQDQLQAEYLLEKTGTDIANARILYNTSLTRMHGDQANVALAQELYDQGLEQYRQGALPLTDVLSYETAVEQAISQYFSSMSGVLLARLDYQKATNTIIPPSKSTAQ